MQSNNPVFRRSDAFNGRSQNAHGNQMYAGNGSAYPTYGEQPPAQPGYGAPTTTGRPMTIDSVVQKTGISLLLVIVAAAITWMMTPEISASTTNEDIAPLIGLMTVGSLAAFGLSIVNSFKRIISPALVMAFAVAEGVALGALSKFFDAQFGDGIVTQAVIGTFAAFAGTLAAYKFFNIQVGQRFRTFVIAAVFGMVGLSLLELVLGMFGSELGLFGFGSLGLLFAVAGLVLGVFMLILDFDFVEKGIAARHRRARVVARGLRADRQPGLDLHQPAADPRDPQLGLTAPKLRRPAVDERRVDVISASFQADSALRNARTASTRRLSSLACGRSSLVKMLLVCLPTAFSETNSRAAIAAFDRPSAIRVSTSVSRGVSRAIGEAWPAPLTSAATTSGSRTVPPPATWRTAPTKPSTSATRSFSRYPTAPSPLASRSRA